MNNSKSEIKQATEMASCNKMASAVHYSDCELDTVTESVTCDAKCENTGLERS